MSATPEQIADERADWLLDAIAGATQDRQFLRGDAECSPVICEAVLLNGAKAIRTAIARAHEARMSAASDSIAEPHSFSPDEIAHRIEHFGATFDLDVMKQAAALIRAQAERVRVLEAKLEKIAGEAPAKEPSDEPTVAWPPHWSDDLRDTVNDMILDAFRDGYTHACWRMGQIADAALKGEA